MTYIKKMDEGVLTIFLFTPIAIKATLETAQARAGYIEQRNALRGAITYVRFRQISTAVEQRVDSREQSCLNGGSSTSDLG